MRRLRCLSALLVSSFLATPAMAQSADSGAVQRDAPRRVRPASRDYYRYSRRGDDSRYAGYRNPGGVGRYAEYYPAGNQFQNDMTRYQPPVATFNGGSGVPTMEEQMAAQSLGVAKYNSIQQSINDYARPYYGYGFYGGFY